MDTNLSYQVLCHFLLYEKCSQAKGLWGMSCRKEWTLCWIWSNSSDLRSFWKGRIVFQSDKCKQKTEPFLSEPTFLKGRWISEQFVKHGMLYGKLRVYFCQDLTKAVNCLVCLHFFRRSFKKGYLLQKWSEWKAWYGIPGFNLSWYLPKGLSMRSGFAK